MRAGRRVDLEPVRVGDDLTRHLVRDPHRPSRWGVPLALLVGLAVGLGAGVVVRGPTASAAPVLVPAEVTHDPSVSATTTATAPPVTISAATPAPPVVAFGEGGFYVSTAGSPGMVTVAPGRYRSAAAGPGETCSWERRDGSDSVRDQTRDPVLLTLRAGNFFRSSGCPQWVKTG